MKTLSAPELSLLSGAEFRTKAIHSELIAYAAGVTPTSSNVAADDDDDGDKIRFLMIILAVFHWISSPSRELDSFEGLYSPRKAVTQSFAIHCEKVH